MPGRVHRADEVRDALVLRRVGVGAGDEDAELASAGPATSRSSGRSPPTRRRRARPGCRGAARSEPGAGLAEQLAPDLLAGQQREQVALLLLLACRAWTIVGPAQPMPIVFDGRRTPAAAQLLVDEELVDRVGVEPPRLAASAARRSRPRPAGGPSASGCSASHARTVERGAGRRRPAARSPPRQRSPCLDRTVKTVGSPAVRTTNRGGTMPGWNFADVWEVVAQQVPDAPAQVQGDRRVTWARVRPAGQRHRPGAARRRRRGAGQGRPVPLQRPRVPRVDVRHASRPASPRSTPTTATRRRARLPLGQRRRRRRRVPRHLRRAHRGHPRPGAAGASSGCGSTTAAARAPTGRRPTRPPPRPARRSRCRAPWGRDGDDLYCSTPAAPPACPRA